jgi:drug/metabolite transporter (DMT)-like permease
MIKNIDKGVLYMLFASLLFAVMGGFAKELSLYMSSLEVVFFRNIFGVLAIGFTFYKYPIKQIGGKPLLLFFRGFMGFMALLAFFYNISKIPLADAMTFSRTSPIFTAIFAYMFLKEKIGVVGWIAVFVGFVGIVFITKPSGMQFSHTDILGIFSGIGAALAYTSVRELKKYYDTRVIVLSFMGIGTIGPVVLFFMSNFIESSSLDFISGEFVMPSGVMWLYIIGLGGFATLAQTFMTKAYGETKAGIVGVVSYANIIFSVIIGTMLGDDLPDMITWCGIILIILSGVAVAKDTKKG